MTTAQLSSDASKNAFALVLLYRQLQHGKMKHTWLTWLSRGHLTRGAHDGRGLHLGPGKHHARGRAPHPSCWPSQTLYRHSQHLEHNITKNTSMRSASETQMRVPSEHGSCHTVVCATVLQGLAWLLIVESDSPAKTFKHRRTHNSKTLHPYMHIAPMTWQHTLIDIA